MEVLNRPLTRALKLMLAVMLWAAPADADERQYKIEAAYLYSFFNYITWPGYDSPQKLIEPTICVQQGDPILFYLDYVKQRMAGERALTIRAVAEGESAAGCHIFFVRHRISPRLYSTVPDKTLLVLKPDDPLDRGGMIELSEDSDRISISVHQDLLEKHGFAISSRLLNLAREVH